MKCIIAQPARMKWPSVSWWVVACRDDTPICIPGFPCRLSVVSKPPPLMWTWLTNRVGGGYGYNGPLSLSFLSYLYRELCLEQPENATRIYIKFSV